MDGLSLLAYVPSDAFDEFFHVSFHLKNLGSACGHAGGGPAPPTLPAVSRMPYCPFGVKFQTCHQKKETGTEERRKTSKSLQTSHHHRCGEQCVRRQRGGETSGCSP